MAAHHSLLYTLIGLGIVNSIQGSVLKPEDITSPTCYLSLLQSDIIKTETLFTAEIRKLRNGSLSCNQTNISYEKTWEKSLSCEGSALVITPGFRTQKDMAERVQINCSASYPLDFNLVEKLPFAGIEVQFGKTVEPGEGTKTLHWLSATFPKAIYVHGEGLEKYTGAYEFISSENSSDTKKMDVRIKIQPSPLPEGTPLPHGIPKRGICLKIYDSHAVCKVNYSANDLYLVNIGGDNPTETRLLRPCLNPNNSCGNTFPGTNCLLHRYCKKIQAIHQHGIARCASETAQGPREEVEVQYFTDLDAEIHTNMSDMGKEDLVIRLESEDNEDNKEIVFEFVENSTRSDPTTSSNKDEWEDCDMPTVVAGVKSNSTKVLNNGDPYSVECHFIPYFIVPPVLWFVKLQNETTERLVFADYGGNTTDETRKYLESKDQIITVNIRSSHFQTTTSLGMESISCQASYWNSARVARSTQLVEVKDGINSNAIGGGASTTATPIKSRSTSSAARTAGN